MSSGVNRAMYVTKRRHRVGRSIKINKYQMSLAYFSLRAYCTLINREAIWINREKAGRESYKNKAERG